jgi:hypothetical protein
MKKYSLGALVAAGLLAGGLSVNSASAADLGGNCCADLEERIAELEATTARKGNRKVSLTISGWVGEQVMWWDDEFEQNVYVGGLGRTLNSHFKITGQATISPGWYAGYVVHVEVWGSETLLMTNQDVATGPSLYDLQDNENVINPAFEGNDFNGIGTLQSFWFVKSDHLGKVSVGYQSQASDNTALLVDGSGSLVPANYVLFDYGGFYLRAANGAPAPNTSIAGTFTHIDHNGLPLNSVRYDSPTFGGFSVSASWGMDDFWDVAARYAGEHAGFKVAVAAAYFENTDESGIPNNSAPGAEHWQIGGYIQHVATGVFLYGAYGDLDNEVSTLEAETWYVKAGLRERWNPLGHTVLYGEYMDGEQETALDPDAGSLELWGLGIVQEIDAAAMSIWLSYRNIEADNGAATCDTSVFPGGVVAGPCGLDLQYVKFGALINF